MAESHENTGRSNLPAPGADEPDLPQAASAASRSARTPVDGEEADMPRMTLGDHLEELRRRLIWALAGVAVATGLALAIARPAIELMTRPYLRAMRAAGMEGDLAVLTLTGGITSYMMTALAIGLLLSAPWVLYQAWLFVSAGLFHRERRAVRLAVPFCVGLFVGGAVFFLWVMAEPMVAVLATFNRWLGLRAVITLPDYLGFVSHMMLATGLAFQTPLVVLVLAWAGVISARTIRHYRRHVIVAILIVGAVLTPPDPTSQLLLAVPMWLLYELGALLAHLLVFRPRTTRSQ